MIERVNNTLMIRQGSLHRTFHVPDWAPAMVHEVAAGAQTHVLQVVQGTHCPQAHTAAQPQLHDWRCHPVDVCACWMEWHAF